MKKINLIVAGIAFVFCLISVFFGASIYNANENALLEHLNDMDNLDYFDADAVPTLTKIVAAITLPFIMIILGFEVFILFKTNIRSVKNIARGIVVAMLILLSIDVITLNDPASFDFSKWGFFWVIFGIITVTGNMISVFVKGNQGGTNSKS